MENQTQNSPQTAKRTPLIMMVVCALIAAVCIAIFAFSSMHKQNSPLADPSPSSTATKETKSSAKAAAQEYEIKQSDDLIKFLNQITRDKEADPKAIGSPNAPVVLLEFSDMSCPLCHRFHALIEPQLKPYIDDGTLRIEYHHRVIFDNRYQSALGAKGAEAAGRQGKFWQFLQASGSILEKQSKETGDGHLQWDEKVVEEVAKAAKVPDLAKLKSDLKDAQIQETIDKEDSQALNLSINGTPTFLVNNKYIIEGAQDIGVFRTVIEAAKEK